jgi:hypothetical protein
MHFLELLNGAFLTDLIIMVLCLTGGLDGWLFPNSFKTSTLAKWYKTFGPSAVLSDVTIIMLVVILAKAIYPSIFRSFSFLKFIGLVICLQLIHDILFTSIINSIPSGQSKIVDVFQEYVKGPFSFVILIVDAVMMASTVLIMTFLQRYSASVNIIFLISLLYIMPYLLFSI